MSDLSEMSLVELGDLLLSENGVNDVRRVIEELARRDAASTGSQPITQEAKQYKGERETLRQLVYRRSADLATPELISNADVQDELNELGLALMWLDNYRDAEPEPIAPGACPQWPDSPEAAEQLADALAQVDYRIRPQEFYQREAHAILARLNAPDRSCLTTKDVNDDDTMDPGGQDHPEPRTAAQPHRRRGADQPGAVD